MSKKFELSVKYLEKLRKAIPDHYGNWLLDIKSVIYEDYITWIPRIEGIKIYVISDFDWDKLYRAIVTPKDERIKELFTAFNFTGNIKNDLRKYLKLTNDYIKKAVTAIEIYYL